MGKVTIIIKSDKLSSEKLEKIFQTEEFSDLIFEDPDVDIFIIPEE